METEKKPNGAFIGLGVIIIILILGAIYIWQANKKAPEENIPATQSVVTTEDSVGLDSLDTELKAVDTNVGVDATKIQ